MLRRTFNYLLVMMTLLLAACTAEPQVVVVEITRLVPDVQEVEVTRLVEREVTRIVEVPAPMVTAPATAAPDLQFMQLELWPDYDQPSVLVLLTGDLSPQTPLPVQITLPIPSSARINAVAQAGDEGLASIPYEAGPGAVRFELTAPRFRVEYYDSYRRDGDERSYRFDWPAPFTIDRLAVRVQEPAGATDFRSDPAPVEALSDTEGGLTYYELPTTAAPAGTPLTLNFSYRKATDDLTVDQPGAAPNLPGGPLHDQQVRSDA